MLLYDVQVRNWIELPIQWRLCLIFVKLWIPVNGTHEGVSGYTISTSFPQVDSWSTNARLLGRHKYNTIFYL